MHILGLANGSSGGHSEILLKAAVTSAQEANPSITTSWIHIPSVSVPLGLEPLKGLQDVSGGNIPLMKGQANGFPQHNTRTDDRRAVLDAILNADALIFATPVYSHQPAGTLKAVIDRIMGPFADASFATLVLERKKAGDPAFQDQVIDERLLKPRVVGFMAVGGSTTPDQFTMTVPTLHLFVYCLHAKVVDQYVVMGCGAPGSVLKGGGEAVERAKREGRNIASEIGKGFDEARFLGEEVEGAYVYCHLAKFELLEGQGVNRVGCVTCGAKGELVVGEDGVVLPRWNEDCDVSSITMKGKLRHGDDIMRNGKMERAAMQKDPDFEAKKRYWLEIGIPKVSLPSLSA